MRITRRTLQLGLGVLWLLDGALQAQPFMFRGDFAKQVIAPAGDGQPWLVAQPVHAVASMTAAHPVLFDAGFAAVQLALGIGLLWRRTTRLALVGSMVWGLAVWWLGEGVGGIAAGETLLTGAPGAALLYAVVAAIAFPARREGSDAAPSWWAAIPAWSALWLCGAALQLSGGHNSAQSLTMTLHDAGTDAGGWVGRLDGWVAGAHLTNAMVSALIALELLVALWALVPGIAQRLSAAVGTLLAAAMWLLTQGLGDLTSGQSTDPNSAPLIVLMALAVAGAVRGARPRWPEPAGSPLSWPAEDRRSDRSRVSA